MEQSAFVAEVQAEHKQSGVTFADDRPVEAHDWGVDFPIFGTKYNVRLACRTLQRENY